MRTASAALVTFSAARSDVHLPERAVGSQALANLTGYWIRPLVNLQALFSSKGAAVRIPQLCGIVFSRVSFTLLRYVNEGAADRVRSRLVKETR